MQADPATEREILAVLESYGEALRSNDADTLINLYTGDDQMMLIGSISGEFAVGAAQVAALYRRIFAEPQRLDLQWERVKVFCSNEVAWLGADGALVSGETRIPYRLTAVLERRGESWKFAHFHGSTSET